MAATTSGSAPFMLTAVGLVLVIAGPLPGSNNPLLEEVELSPPHIPPVER